jgi:predicted phage terminase large subunit-like protein
MVIAPTYTLLHDAVFRSFLSLAETLGVVQDVKRSAPPEIKLRTGAEVLFRSGDEPDRLRGANLSGVFLDEASLMNVEVFNIAIGRLREEGHQGWLSACFTPRGRRHWTFEVFGTDRPDTALFTCKTVDNSFLPPTYYEAVRRQYTSFQAAQELEGQFIDQGGLLFRRAWFPVVDAAPPIVGRCRSWDLAGTDPDEKSARDPDYTAGVLLGRGYADGNVYILDVKRGRGTPQTVQSLVLGTALNDGRGVPVWMEQEPGSAGKAVISHYLRLLTGYVFKGERSTGSKTDRAQPLAALAEGGAVKLVKGIWNADLLDELESFPFGKHDDQTDALSLGLAKLAAAYKPQAFDPTCILALTDGYADPALDRNPAHPFLYPNDPANCRNRAGCVSPDDPRFFHDGYGGMPGFG